jgi:signal transduction histidine kinase
MELHADSARLCQAFTNLIINAAKFSEHGAVIRVHAARNDGDCVVVVSGDGLGIAAVDLDTIFELQGQLQATDSELGGGLYLARRFVEAHGGTLLAASAGVDRGRSFTLRIPCVGFYPEAAAFPNWDPSSRSVSAFTTA